jgi:4-amino-4-deoxy-L-arabinose transferase-like glycosyltransferase
MTRRQCLSDIAILAFLCLISFFVGLELTDVDLMESRNFVTAREMVAENNWLIPTMNGELRLAKPPMPTWFAALSSKLAGASDNLAALRVPSSLAACLMIFSAYGLSWAFHRNRRLAFLTAAMLATSVLTIAVGRTGSWDIFCHAFMVGALYALWVGLHSKAGIWAFAATGILLGLSSMSKGPVAFYAILLPFLIAYITFFGLEKLKEQWRGLVLALAICILFSVWWPLYIFVQHADVARLVVHKESGAWFSRHLKPFWYYAHFLLYAGGWLVWAFAALVRPYAARRVEDKRLHAFLLLWLAAALILLSVIPEKKDRYLLPAMIPLLYLAGIMAEGIIQRFTTNRDQRIDRALVLAHTALISILALALPLVLGYFLLKQGQPIDWKIIAYGGAFCSAAFLLIRFQRQRQVERLLLATITILSLTTLAITQYYGMLTTGYYAVLSTENKGFKRIDSRTLFRDMDAAKVYQLGEPVDMRILWDLGRRTHPWQTEEVNQRLEQGKPVAVLSKGDPLPLLPQEFRGRVSVRIVDTFDYNRKQPDWQKIYLAILQKQTGTSVQ